MGGRQGLRWRGAARLGTAWQAGHDREGKGSDRQVRDGKGWEGKAGPYEAGKKHLEGSYVKCRRKASSTESDL